jgi:hypothetical protein
MTATDLLGPRQRLVLITDLAFRWMAQDADHQRALHAGHRQDVDPAELAELLATSQTRLDLIRHLSTGTIPDTEETP